MPLGRSGQCRAITFSRKRGRKAVFRVPVDLNEEILASMYM